MNTIKLLLLLVGCTLVFSSHAQQISQPMSNYAMQEKSTDYEPVVRNALVTLRGMINAENAQAMGFRSDKEVEQAKPDTPIPLLLIQLDDLRAYQRGNNIHPLFKNYQQYLLPLSVNNEVRSSITLERKDQQLSAISYGSPTLARTLTKVRQEAARQQNVPVGKFYSVHVAALRQYFIAYDDPSGKVMFIPVVDDNSLNLRAGRAVPAEDALESLKTIAQSYNDLPI
jgi:hypothetical protein